VGRYPGFVCGQLKVSFVCGGLAQVGQPFPFVGRPLAYVGQPFPFVKVLVAAGPRFPTRFGGAGPLIGGLGALDGLVGSARSGRAFVVLVVFQASLLRLVGDVSTLLAADGTRDSTVGSSTCGDPDGGPDHGCNIRVPLRCLGCTYVRGPPGSEERRMPSPRPSLESYRWLGGTPRAEGPDSVRPTR
jgi:hypothetical protein